MNRSLQNINNSDYDYANPQEISVNGFTATTDGYLFAYTNVSTGEDRYLEIIVNGVVVSSVVQVSASYGDSCTAHIKKGNVVTFMQYNDCFRRAMFYPKLAQ